MKLFRRKPSEEAADLPVEDAPPAEAGTEPGPEPDEKRPWFRRRKQTDREIAAPDLSPGAPAPAAPEPTAPERTRPPKRRKSNDPAAVDEALAPLTMELAGSRRFTVVVAPAREPGAPPVKLPPVLGKPPRRWGFLRRRSDPLDEIMAMVAPVAEVEAEMDEAAVAEPVARLRLPWEMRWGALIVSIMLLGVAALHILGVPQALDLWPLGVVAAGVLLMPGGVRRATGDRLMGSFALIAAGVSVIVAQQTRQPFATILAAALVIAFGATAVVRGLFAPRRAA